MSKVAWVSVLKRQQTGFDFRYQVYTHTGYSQPQLSTCKGHMFEFRACAVAVNVWAHIYLYIYIYLYIIFIYNIISIGTVQPLTAGYTGWGSSSLC